MERSPQRPAPPLASLPVGLVERVLDTAAVRPGVVDTAQRRLTLAPLPTAHLLAASVVAVLLAGRRDAAPA